MRIYTSSGDLAFKTFTFPDGQPHFKLETYELDFTSATIETTIKSGNDLLLLALVAQTLRQHGYREINLDVRYLLGARMDRAIDSSQQTINAMGFSKVRILDVHSEVGTRLIRNSTNLLPYAAFGQARNCSPDVFVVPDKGAIERCSKLFGFSDYLQIVSCGKKRDMQTGALTGFEILSGSNYFERGRTIAMIVDDICDGGGTFTGLAKVLREAGAKKVYLFVTHGIFSKGLPLEGIDRVFTTDSYVATHDSNRGPIINNSGATVIPISMKEMK